MATYKDEIMELLKDAYEAGKDDMNSYCNDMEFGSPSQAKLPEGDNLMAMIEKRYNGLVKILAPAMTRYTDGVIGVEFDEMSLDVFLHTEVE